jgi:hypothetical protein
MAVLVARLILGMTVFLLLTGAACFAILVKGSLMLRRLARELPAITRHRC